MSKEEREEYKTLRMKTQEGILHTSTFKTRDFETKRELLKKEKRGERQQKAGKAGGKREFASRVEGGEEGGGGGEEGEEEKDLWASSQVCQKMAKKCSRSFVDTHMCTPPFFFTRRCLF